MPAGPAPRLMLATDGDQAADGAVELVSAILRRSVTVQAVSVVPTGIPAGRHVDAGLIAQAAAEELRRAGFESSSSAPEGRPGATIARLAGVAGTDVVVLGAGNRPGRPLGGVVRGVLDHASCGVLVVREVVASAPTEVVVAVDDTERAAAAVELAGRLLDPRRCRVTVLGVAEVLVPALSPPRIRHATTTTTATDREHDVAVAARGHVAEAATRLRAHGFETRERVVAGEPVRRILEEVAGRGAGLVVLGGRGLGTVEGALLGSVSRAVLARAPATLVVPS